MTAASAAARPIARRAFGSSGRPTWAAFLALSVAHALPLSTLSLTHLTGLPKSFLAPLTAPWMTKSIALLIGAWTFWISERILSEMPPRPSRLARKEIISGSALARLSSILAAIAPMLPFATAAIESSTELTKAMISLPRSIRNMMMS